MTSPSQSSSELPDPSSILYEPPRILETQRQPFKTAWKDSFLLTQYIRMSWKKTTIEKLQSGTILSHPPTRSYTDGNNPPSTKWSSNLLPMKDSRSLSTLDVDQARS